jgi:hypothetical protein
LHLGEVFITVRGNVEVVAQMVKCYGKRARVRAGGEVDAEAFAAKRSKKPVDAIQEAVLYSLVGQKIRQAFWEHLDLSMGNENVIAIIEDGDFVVRRAVVMAYAGTEKV